MAMTADPPRSLQRLFVPPVGDKCAHCEKRVYQVEKVGPVNEVVFHKQCFKCIDCGNHLSLKTYFTNQTDFADKKLYCQKHCPKVSMSGYDASAFGIRSAMSAPNKGSRQNDLIRGTGDAPRIDLDAWGIRGAMAAQSDYRRKYITNYDKHHFPAYLVNKTRDKLYEYQKQLEDQQREEEDRMMAIFQEERRKEAERMENELKEEWEGKLQELTSKFDKNPAADKGKDKDLKSTERYEQEMAELKKTMKMKTVRLKQQLTVKLQSKAQQETATMVKAQSDQMLKLLKEKEDELKKALEDEIKSTPGMEADVSEEMIDRAWTALAITTDIPEAHPPKLRKRDLYHDPSVFEELDKDVFKVAEGEQGSFTELVRQLTAHCLSDLQKARAIFRWITVKDLNVMEFDETIQQDTPMGLLRGIKFGTETYHTLFIRLCSYAGLACQEVRGHSKSVGYEPGMKIREDTFQNTWNVVLILGDWWPVQCNWGARHLVLNKDPKDKNGKQQQPPSRSTDNSIRYQYDEHYFLTDPDEFIQEFWAKDPEWQLLDRPITLEEFETLPFVRSVFFHYGLEFSEPLKSVLYASAKGGMDIRLNVTGDEVHDLVFHYQLRFADRERRNDVEFMGAKLERFVFQTIGDGWVLFSVHVPAAASYFLEIFCSRIEEGNKIGEDPNASMQPFKLKCATKFKVVCEELSGKMHPLPSCSSGEWGPSKGKRHFDLVPVTHPSGVINVADQVEIRIQVTRPLVFLCRLRHNEVEDSSLLDKFVTQGVADGVLTIRLTFPKVGQYGLDVYARPKDSSNVHTMAHALKYLINCTGVTTPAELPASSSGTLTSQNKSPSQPAAVDRQPSPQPSSNLGPTPAFTELGLKTISHKDPTIDKVDKGGSVTIEMAAPDSTVLTHQLFRDPDEEWHNKVTAKKGSKKYKFSMILPKEGQYRLLVFAGKKDEPQNKATVVYTYLIRYELEDSKKKKGLFGKS